MRQVNIHWKPSKKQLEAFNILEDKQTTELFYGGAAGGGKSYLGCAWLILSCLKYQGSRWLMGRAVLKALKESTLLTFFQICGEWGLIKDEDYKYDSINGVITFLKTGSQIYLKDLFAYPSDPEFADLGSREFTGVFIDEASQITQKAFNICKSRIRFKLEEFGLIPKILIASNPSKNFLYYDFYKPYKNNTLPMYRQFLPALVQDNPFISEHYIENLKKLDKVSKERLLYGNFEYDDDEAALFEYDAVLNMFERTIRHNGHQYLTIDVARFGSDMTTIMYWRGLDVMKIWAFKKMDLKQLRLTIQAILSQRDIPLHHIIADEGGLGAGLVDEMRGIVGFVSNARPLELKQEQNPTSVYTEPPRHNYANLKSQCYFLLAHYINNGHIGIYRGVNEKIKEMLIEDLEQIKQKDIDKDGKLAIIPKEEMKEALGRSTDLGDALMMRMFYELKAPKDKTLFQMVHIT